MALTRPAPARPDADSTDRARSQAAAPRPAAAGRTAIPTAPAALLALLAAVLGLAGLIGPHDNKLLISIAECIAAASALLSMLALFLARRGAAAQARAEQADARDQATDTAVAAQPPGTVDASVRHAYVSLARRIQALVNRQLREVREMEDRHGADPAVLADLMHLDHATALIGRLADSLAVLGGEQTGRRWTKPAPLLAVVRGAMSRITEYRRVNIDLLPESAAVAGEAVEGLAHALAELLDNATRYSPPDTQVVLTAYPVPDGLVIEVEDNGLGLSPEARDRAELVLEAENSGLEITANGDTPRLGLAVVGRLARATGFTVTLGSAPGAGVRASILLPARLVSREAAEAAEFEAGDAVAGRGPVPQPVPAPGQPPASPVQPVRRHAATGPAIPPQPIENVNGLPQRQRTVRDDGAGPA